MWSILYFSVLHKLFQNSKTLKQRIHYFSLFLLICAPTKKHEKRIVFSWLCEILKLFLLKKRKPKQKISPFARFPDFVNPFLCHGWDWDFHSYLKSTYIFGLLIFSFTALHEVLWVPLILTRT